MGCSSSKITVVEPVNSSQLEGEEKDTVSKQGAGGRGDSAVSKFTTDSGVVLETGEIPTLPGAVPRTLPPLATHSPGLTQESSERPRSSDILEQLLNQGIIPAQPRERASGEAYNIMMDDTERPKRRPPPRLESLKISKDQTVTKKEDIEERMRQAEERRKLREEELRTRLRTKSARVRVPASATLGEGDVVTGVEVFQAPDASEILARPPGETLADPQDTLQTQRRNDGEVRGSGGEGASDGCLLTASQEVDSDSTFQQTEQTEDIF